MGEIRVTTDAGGKDDFTEQFELKLPVRMYDSTIFAGLRAEWGRIENVDGRGPLVICSGAGFGSAWATIDFDGKRYAISARDLVEAFLAHLGVEATVA